MPTLEKNVAIARSGVYEYRPQEVARMLGITIDAIPAEYKSFRSFGVYRPAPVIASSVDKFTKLPAVLEHPGVPIDGKNFRDFTMGWTGDSAIAEYLSDSNEVVIKSSLNLIDDEAVRAYRSGVREVSPGYSAKFTWSVGVAPDGKKYQIVMDSIESVNHLAMTRAGRGGEETSILDSKQSGIGYALRKFIRLIEDSDMGMFRDNINALMQQRQTVTEPDMGLAVEDLMSMTTDLPETNEKNQLIRHLQDLPRMRDLDDVSAQQAGDVIADLYEKLDADAMGDVGQSEDSMAKFFGRGKVKDSEPTPDKGSVEEVKEKKIGDAEPPAAPAPDMAPEAAAAPMAQAKPMSIDEVPENPDDMDETHVKYLLGELRGMLKAGRPGEEAPTAAAATDAPTNPAGGERHMHFHVGDSLFSSSQATQAAAKKASEILASIAPTSKRGKR